MAERHLVRSTSVAESGVAREHGLSTDLDEEMDKLTRVRAALRSGPAEIGAWMGFEGCVVHWR